MSTWIMDAPNPKKISENDKLPKKGKEPLSYFIHLICGSKVRIGNRHPIETKFGHRAVIFHARGAPSFNFCIWKLSHTNVVRGDAQRDPSWISFPLGSP